jgi:hypothetical protein
MPILAESHPSNSFGQNALVFDDPRPPVTEVSVVDLRKNEGHSLLNFEVFP